MDFKVFKVVKDLKEKQPYNHRTTHSTQQKNILPTLKAANIAAVTLRTLKSLNNWHVIPHIA